MAITIEPAMRPYVNLVLVKWFFNNFPMFADSFGVFVFTALPED